MALTPLTVTRRNVVALDFTSTTLVSGTTTTNVAYNNFFNHSYPPIVGYGGEVSQESTEGGDYTFIFVNGQGEEFGVYYENEQRSGGAGAGSSCALNRAKNAFVITNTGVELSPAERYHYTAAADPNDIVNGGNRLPADDGIIFPALYGGTSAFLPVFNIGGADETWGHIAFNFNDSSIRLFDMLTESQYKAFVPETGYDFTPTQHITLSDTSFNYTFVDADPDSETGSTLYMSKWTAEATVDPFSYTNYSIELSDAADDAVFQASADYDFADFRMLRGNYENFVYSIVSSSVFPLESMTAFVFAKDFSWYDRIDITSNGDLSFGLYFQDIEGNHFLVGAHNSAGCSAFQLIQAEEGGAVEDEDTNIRVWPFSLDGHDFAVFRLGSSESLIYDLSTDQWSRWISPDVERWRPHVGQNWSGMASTTFANGFGSDVVCGDDTLGVLYILDPTAGMDDDPVTGTATEFTRKTTGLITVNGRETIGCGAVTLGLAKGDPAQVGATISLRTSDDWGNTWISHGSKTITASEWDAVIEWRALGRIKAPGRIFELTDNGASVRLNSADMR